MKRFNIHPHLVKCQKIALHPRTQATAEVVYAAHGILHGTSWVVWLIYGFILIVAFAHLIWASHVVD